MKTAQNTVPELRFPEFEGEWKLKRGNDLFLNSRIKGEDGLPIYSVTLNDGLVPRASLDKKMENDAASGDNLRAQAGDLVYNMMRMWQGALGLAHEECMISPAYVVLSGKAKTDTKFFEYNLKRPRSIYDLWAYSYGLTNDRLRLYSKDFLRIKFRVPEEKLEQQKIASFLSSIDDKLTKLRRKRELLNDFKRGLMQQLFSQAVRFKQDDGSEFPEWEYEEFRLLVDRVSKSYNSSIETVNYPAIELESLDQGSGKILNIFNSLDQKSTKTLFNQGDVLFGKLRPYLKKFARPNFDGVCSSEIWVLRGKKITNDFLFFVVQTSRFQKVVNIQSGSKMPRADWNSVADAVFLYPCLEEQQKIADCLSSFDAKIDAVVKQIQQLDTFKKGLLQKMFV
ncbi:restriction endonuclease subunit S [Marinomonas sp. RSW2]|uniref:Restriction endonuclease subunit S n=1 Tax=Marinomonas maritima TaxID=2940935 RepID=A0ABT5WHN5_9GAMM|nr:restriction endonuclease subunit S [Marinomonas maritima]MDE8604333.1 restriction endonuclease subunit S [Marinomonas maritima]